MGISRKIWRITVCVSILIPLLIFSSNALAAEEIKKPPNYPNRSIEFVVTWGPGGGSDTFARAVCKEAEKILGVPIAVVNMPGGTGIAGMAYVMNQPADGYTLFGLGVDQVFGWVLQRHSYTVNDWAPICRGQADVDMFLCNSKEDRFSSWQELVNYSKKNPKAMFTVASPGLMSSAELLLKEISNKTGVRLKAVPFDSFGERSASVVGGHIDLLYEYPGTSRSFVEAGQLKPLMALLDHRIDDPLFKDAISAPEAGINDMTIFEAAAAWRGISGKKGIPQEIVTYLDKVFEKAMQADSYKQIERKRYLHIRKGYLGHEDFLKNISDGYGMMRKNAIELNWIK